MKALNQKPPQNNQWWNTKKSKTPSLKYQILREKRQKNARNHKPNIFLKEKS